ncbi:MAG: hypothetical protein C7B45_13220 [Sulfobacillus acidophilus]|uniref:DUF4352 domain-containing protein n=1 Tax=Sulfobacillus acidophilus TaxID=53633 RepID=A0A2T2WF35_9FIRM|nr:MAG: hypothetical protein C7B45_13220 [Sulfobacillus acidophilus]
MKQRSMAWRLLAVSLPMMLIAVGCGQQLTPQALAHHHQKTHHKSTVTTSSSPSPSASASPSPSVSPSTSTTTVAPTSTSSVPVQSPSTPASPVLTSVPPAGGVASANQVQATVNTVQLDGTAAVNSQTDYVYLINVTLRNPTTAMILFPLADLVVTPSTSAASSSLNDFDMTGITPSNSLFPYPIVPTHPQAVVVRVPSGASVSGDFTVEVAPSSQYDVHIAGINGAIATFSV